MHLPSIRNNTKTTSIRHLKKFFWIEVGNSITSIIQRRESHFQRKNVFTKRQRRGISHFTINENHIKDHRRSPATGDEKTSQFPPTVKSLIGWRLKNVTAFVSTTYADWIFVQKCRKKLSGVHGSSVCTVTYSSRQLHDTTEREREGEKEKEREGKNNTVGHPRDRDFMSVAARVRNSGVGKKVLVAYNYVINGINYDIWEVQSVRFIVSQNNKFATLVPKKGLLFRNSESP